MKSEYGTVTCIFTDTTIPAAGG